jgi:hypothetical protein
LDRTNSVIKEALNRIDRLDSDADIKRFRRALKYAVHGDGNLPPKIYSPEKIAELTGISLESQFEMWILLDRKRAIQFLESLDRRVRPEGFRKKLSASNYRSVHGRKRPARVANSYVFTHLEIMRIVNETRILVIPSS